MDAKTRKLIEDKIVEYSEKAKQRNWQAEAETNKTKRAHYMAANVVYTIVVSDLQILLLDAEV